MKISFILNFYPRKPGGGMKVIHEYANYLADKGHDVTLYYEYCENNISNRYHLPGWVKLKIMKYNIEFKAMTWFELNKKIKRIAIRKINDLQIKDSDIIIATAVETAMPVANLTDSKGKKIYLIQDFENWYVSEKEVYETYSQDITNIVVANWLKKIVDKYSKEPSVLISNSINTDIFRVNNSIKERENHTLAFHYRSASHKGCKYAIETIKILEKIYPDLMVYVISIEDEPENLPKCCKYFKNLNPYEVAEINNKVKVFMCSSIEEGFGLPGLEAMACGCALVSTEYKGVREYAIDGKNSLLSKIRNPQDMAENIKKIFDDEELRMKIVKNGIETAKERSLELAGEKFEKVLIGVFKQNK